MRLIDVDALADALFDKRKNYPQWVADTIGNMPDAIVRCKDCKYLIDHYGFMDDGYCKKMLEDYNAKLKPKKGWFCADGKRKEGR